MKSTRTLIRFYSVSDEYGEFSNFAPFPIKLKGKTWPTVEHYFQAQKYAGTPIEEKIRKSKDPQIAAQIGRSRRLKIRKDWEAVKESVMLEALEAKFNQHRQLRDLLISTGDARLVEHTDSDSYWGDGGNGTGKNRLGILLMLVRERLNSLNDVPESADKARLSENESKS